MKKLIICLACLLACSSASYAHNGMLALYADSSASDCDTDIAVWEQKDILLYYVRGNGPAMGSACEFRIVRSTNGAVFLTPEWSDEFIANLGLMETGISLTADGCLGYSVMGDMLDYVYIGRIPILCVGDTDTFTVRVVEDPEANPPGIYITSCMPGNPRTDVFGGSFVFNGQCNTELVDASGLTPTRLDVSFSLDLDEASVENVFNYQLFETHDIGNSIGIVSATLQSNPRIVTLMLADSLREGTDYTLKVYNIMSSGGNPIPAGTDISVNLMFPSVTITEGPAEGEQTGDTTIQFEWSGFSEQTQIDSLRYAHSLDGGPQSAWSTDTFTVLTGLTEGAHSLQLWVKDHMENLEDVTRGFIVDLTGPSASVDTWPSSGWLSTASFTFAWSGSDNYSPADSLLYSFQLDGGPWSSFAPDKTLLIDNLTAGPHIFMVKALDIAGNEGDSTSVSFTVDFIDPETWATQPLSENINGLWGSSGSDVFAVGANGMILHYNGSSWAPQTSGTSEHLFAAWGFSSSEVGAVGSNGTILSYDGVEWFTFPQVTTNWLYGTWGTSFDDGYAVGAGGIILHYYGVGVDEMESGTKECLYAVWGSAGNNVYAVGAEGTILHFDGAAWSAMASGTTNHLFGVWGSAGNNVYAVGANGTILRYEGASWSVVVSGASITYRAVWGSSSDNFYVGSDRVSGASFTTILHYDGVWDVENIGAQAGHIHALWGSAANDVFAAGLTKSLVHYNGSAWTSFTDCRFESELLGPSDGVIAFYGNGSDDMSAPGNLQYSYSLSGPSSSSWSTFGSSASRTYNISGYADGLYTVRAKSRDLAGNVDVSPAAVSFWIDKTSPTTLITGGPEKGEVVFGDSVYFCWAASDLWDGMPYDGIIEFRYELDGDGPGSWTTDTCVTVPITTEGNFLFEVWARDIAGNTGHAQRSFIKPEILHDPMAVDTSTYFVWGDLNVQWNSDEDGYISGSASPDLYTGIISRRIYDTSINPFVIYRILNVPGVSMYMLGYTGTGAETSDFYGMNIDYGLFVMMSGEVRMLEGTTMGDPLTTLGAGVFDLFISLDQAGSLITFMVDEVSTVLDPMSDFSSPLLSHTETRTLDDRYYLQANPYNNSSKVYDIWSSRDDTDILPPETMIISGPPDGGYHNSTTANIGWTGTDNQTPVDSLVYSYQYDGSVWTSYAYTTYATLLNLTEGPHSFIVKARDFAMNEDPTPDTLNYFIDFTDPVMSIIEGPENGEYTDVPIVVFSWTGSDNITGHDDLRYSYRMDSEPFSSWTTDTTVSLTEIPLGRRTFEVRMKDLADNIVTDQRTFHMVNIVHDPMAANTHPYFDWRENNITWHTEDDGYLQGTAGATWHEGVVSRRGVDPSESPFIAFRALFDPAVAGFFFGFSDTNPLTTNFYHTNIDFGFYVHTTGNVYYALNGVGPNTGAPLLTPGIYDFRVALDLDNNLVSFAIEEVADIGDPLSDFKSPLWSSVQPHTILDNEYYMQINPYNEDSRLGDVWSSRLVHDVIPPETQITAGPLEGSVVDALPVTIEWTGSDDQTPTELLEYAFRIDGGAYSSFSTDTFHTFTVLDDGSHIFEVKARDIGLNEDGSPDSRSFITDVSPPFVVITGGPIEGEITTSTSATFTWTATDAVSPADSLLFSYRMDSDAFTTWDPDTFAAYPVIPEGTHLFELRARDLVGHIRTLQRQFAVDLTPPAAQIVSGPEDGGWSADTTAFTWTGSDNISPVDSIRYSHKLDNDPWSEFSLVSGATYFSLDEATHTFMLTARDLAGLIGDTVIVTFEVDVTEPETWITLGPAEGGLVSALDDSITFGWSGSDDRIPAGALEFSYQLDGVQWSNFVPDTFLTIPAAIVDGTHTFRVKARDLALNEDPTPAERSFVIDRTPPLISATGGPADGQHVSLVDIGFCWTASDGFSPRDSLEFSYILDGGAGSTWGPDTCVILPALAEGNHELDIRSRDQAGNMGNLLRRFTVDRTPPAAVVLSGPDDGGWSTDSVPFTWTGSDSLSPSDSLLFSYKLDADPWSTYSHETGHIYDGLAATPHVFMLRAMDLAGNKGDSVTVSFEVDVIEPETWIATGPSEGEVIGSVQDFIRFTWGGSDDKTPAGSLLFDRGFTGYSGFGPDTSLAIAVSLFSDGVHTFSVKARDLALNEDPSPATRSFIVDLTPPVITVVVGPLEVQHVGETEVDLCWTASDGFSPRDSLEFSYRLDGGAQSSWGSDTCAALSGLAEGEHVLEIWARDEAGNEGHEERRFVIDLTPPLASIVSGPEEGGWSDASAEFTWTGSDNLSPLDSLRYSYRLDDDPWSDYSHLTSHIFEGLSDTIHTFMVQARDLAGNTGDSTTVTFEVDILPPDTWFSSGRPDGWVVGPTEDLLTYTWQGSDDKAPPWELVFSYRLDTGAWSALDPGLSHTFSTNLSDGAHSFTVKAHDPAGNEDPTPATRSFIVDKTPPVVSITSGPAEGEHQSEISAQFCWAATDGLSPPDSLDYSFRIDAGAQSQWDTATCVTIPVLDEGEHELTVWARDEAGNEGSTLRHFTIDQSPPVVTVISGPEPFGWSDPMPEFVWSGSDNLAPSDSLWFSYRLDDDPWSEFSRTTDHTFGPLSDTTHVFMVVARDLAGNRGDSVSVVFDVDNSPPETEITSGPAEGEILSSSQGSVTYEWSGSDDRTAAGELWFSHKLDEGAWSPFEESTSRIVQLNIGDGTHTFMVKARDLALNEDPTPVIRTFIIDGTPPVIAITSGPYQGRQLGTTDVGFCWTASDSRSPADSLYYSYDLDGGAQSPWAKDTCTAFSELGEGVHSFQIRARDEVENIGLVLRDFVVDLTPPVATVISGPAEGGWSDASPVFAWTGSDNFAPLDSLSFSFRMDDGAWSAFSYGTDHAFSDLTAGIHVFMVKARDLAGNAGDSTTVTFEVDIVPPETQITTAPPPGGIVDTSIVAFGWTGSDDNTPAVDLTYSIKLDNLNFTPFSMDTSTVFGNLSDGSHLFMVKARDLSDNIDPSPDSLTFIVDATAPSIAFTGGPAEGAHLGSGDLMIEWEGSDFISPIESLFYSYRLDGDDFSGWAMNTAASLEDVPEGMHAFMVRARDERDHIGLNTREFIVDMTPPEALITGGPGEGGCWPHSIAGFDWTGSDNFSDPAELQFAYSMDGAPYSAWGVSTSHEFTGLVEGPHALMVKSRDLAGNEALQPDTVNFTVGHNDLITAVIDLPDSAYCNRELSVSWTVTNDGNCAVNGEWYDRVYLSSDDIAGSDIYLDDFTRNETVPAGESYIASHSVLLPDNLEGEYWLVVVADAGSDILEEGYEANNSLVSDAVMLSLPPHPDLQVTSINVPDEGWSGRGEYVEWTVSNTGEASTGGGWTEYVYLSDDPVAGNDLLLSQFNYPYALDAGSSYTHTHAITFPEDISGSYWIVLCADAGYDVSEYESESNNCSASSDSMQIQLTPYPNLVVTNIEIPPDSVNSNDETEISWTVTNTGGAPTSSPVWYDKVYLSATTDPGGQLLGEYENMSYLGTGESYTQQNIAVTIPKQVLDGTYHIVVVTDSRNNVDEHHDEGDNVTASDPMPVRYVPYPRPDLAITKFIPSFVGWAGNPVTLTWEVTNIGNEAAEGYQIVDWVWMSTDNVIDPHNAVHIGGSFVGDYLEPDSSYSRTVQVTIPANVSGTRYLYVWTDVDLRYDDPDITNNFSEVYPIEISLPPTPDLMVESVTTDRDSIYAGSSLQVQWRVENEGAGPGHIPDWRDAIYLSEDDSLDTGSDLRLAKIYHYGYLESGTGYDRAYSVTIPGGTTGNRYVFVYTDIDNNIPEGEYEDNNSKICVIPVFVEQPPAMEIPETDLTVIAAGTAASAWSGTPFEVSWTVKNLGPDDVSVSSWYDRIYLSPDSTLETGSDMLLLTRSHPGPLPVNGTYSEVRSVTTPDGVSGMYYVIFKTDATGAVLEPGKEGNNTMAVPLTIDLTPPPDLQVSELLSSSDTLLAGEVCVAQWTVRNFGTGGTVSNSWTDRFYLSSDQNLDIGSDLYLIGFSHSGGLDAGQFYQQSRNVTIPSGYSGDYYLIAYTDGTGQVYEHGLENNNTRATAVIITVPPQDPPPDLAMESLSFIDGERDTLFYRVRNVSDYGVPSAQRNWTDRFYLSADSILSTSSDEIIASYGRVGDLAPGSSYSRTKEVTLPEGTEGDYYIIGVTDVGVRVDEASEANNQLFVAQHIVLTSPDLLAGDVGSPGSLSAGQPTKVHWTVQNVGTGRAYPETWYDGIYLSIDHILDETDYNLGSRYHQGGLAVTGSYTDSVEVTIPPGLSGHYYFFVKTDKNHNVYEHGLEDNNISYASSGVDITIPPPDVDLVVSDVILPTDAISGDSVSINWSVTNQSSSDLEGQWKDAIYVSPDTIWDLSDAYLGSVTQASGLGAGARYVQTFTIAAMDYYGFIGANLPGLLPGGYHVVIRTDIRNNINESNEGNNTGFSATDMSIDLATLQMGVPYSSSIQYREQQYYKLVVPPGHDVRLFVDIGSPYDELEIFFRYGQVPDRISYEFAEKVQGYEELIIPGSEDGDCYIMLYGDYVPGDGSFTITPESFLFGLTEVEPAVVDNTGFVTFAVTGGHLGDAVAVKLLHEAGDTLEAWKVRPVNSTRVEASFDLRGVEIGQYDLQIAISDPDTTDLSPAVQIVAGQGPVVIPDIKGPDAIRQSVLGNYVVTLRNSGESDAHDVISSVSMGAGIAFQLVLDDMIGGVGISNGEPIHIYTSNIGVDNSSEYTIRLWGESDLSIDAVTVESDPHLVQSQAGPLVVSTWVGDVADAFVESVEAEGVNVDSEVFNDLYVASWNEQNEADEGGTITTLLNNQIEAATLGALDALGDPLLPAQDQGLTSLGLDTSVEVAQIYYDETVVQGRYKKKKKDVTVRVARDPNEKLGPTQPDEENFITQLQDVPYTLYFENVEDASAAARQVVVTDQLDEDLDWRKFRLGEIAFGDIVIPVPLNKSYYHTTISLDSIGMLLEIDAGINVVSGQAHWIFNTIDPTTGQPPLDPNAGFLPPNDSLGSGEGHVFFTIKTDPDATDGTEVRNKALIVFDTNDPIITNEVVNVVQRVYPDLAITSSSGQSAYPEFIEGEQIVINATIGNSSDAPTGSFTVAFFDGDPDAGGTLIGTPKPVADLEGNSETVVQATWVPLRTLAQHRIHIVADYDTDIDEIDEENNERVLVLEAQPKTYTVNLPAGISIVSLPLEPIEPLTAQSFIDLLGASEVIRYDAGTGIFVTYVTGQGTGDFVIEKNEGYIVSLGAANSVTFTGITHNDSMDVRKGLNMASLPLEPDESFKARDLCTALDADMVIRYRSATQEFEAFIEDFHSGDGFEILGARGYLAVGNNDKTAVFAGTGWIGEENVPPGELLFAANEESRDRVTHVLGVVGALYQKEWDDRVPISGECTAEIRNTSNDCSVPLKVFESGGRFSGAFVDFMNDQPIHAGDLLEIVVSGPDGAKIGDPVEHIVTSGDIERGYVVMEETLTGLMPNITRLYQNFPNPFNPVTHIRYQIAKQGAVSLKIYNVAGQLVATLVNEAKRPGYYEIAWKGRNNNGVQVASGVYFLRLQTPGYKRSLKMVIIR